MIAWHRTLPPLSQFRVPHLAVPGVFHRLDHSLAETWLTFTDTGGAYLGFCLLLRESDAEGRRWVRLEGAEVLPPGEEVVARAMLECARKTAASQGLVGVRFLQSSMPLTGLYPSSDTWFGAGNAGVHLARVCRETGAECSDREVLLRLPCQSRSARHSAGELREEGPPVHAEPGAPAGERRMLGLSRAWRLIRGDARAFVLACPDLGPEVLATGGLPRQVPFAGRSAVLWHLEVKAFSPSELAGFVLDVAGSIASTGPTGLYVRWPVDGALPLLLEAGAEIMSRITEWRLSGEEHA